MILKLGSDEGEHRFLPTDEWTKLAAELAGEILQVQLGAGEIAVLVEAVKTDPNVSLEQALEDAVRERVRSGIVLALQYGFSRYRNFYECPRCKRLTVFWDRAVDEATTYTRD